MTFMIEQLEALKEGTTPGKWHATDEVGGSDLIIDGTGESLLAVGYVADGWASFTTVADGKLAAASPALLDQLIAAEKARQKLREELALLSSKLGVRADNAQKNGAFSSAVAFRETAHGLIEILEGSND